MVILRCKFEVFGKVQKVFFRKYTEEKAKLLSITGWCENTKDGTVHGEIEGEDSAIGLMQSWLCKEGSPQCSITKCVFSEVEQATHRKFETFRIRR